jgi:hypothetical protein
VVNKVWQSYRNPHFRPPWQTKVYYLLTLHGHSEWNEREKNCEQKQSLFFRKMVYKILKTLDTYTAEKTTFKKTRLKITSVLTRERVHTAIVLFICLSSARQLKCLRVSKTESYGISRICFEMTRQATMPSSKAWLCLADEQHIYQFVRNAHYLNVLLQAEKACNKTVQYDECMVKFRAFWTRPFRRTRTRTRTQTEVRNSDFRTRT